MQKRGLIMLLIALIMGGVAVSLVNTMLKESEKVATSAVTLETTPVVVASMDIEVGTRLSAVTLEVADWPKESAPEGVFASIDTLVGEEPPVIIKEVRKGEAILPYKLSGPGARGGLTTKIPDNMRAMTIAVNEVRGVAGFVLPGNRVDVLLTTEVDEKVSTSTLVQHILVLGVDQISSEKEDKPLVVNAVTLLVTKKQGKVLTLAQTVGTLTLLLRNESDVVISAEASMDLADLKLMKPEKVTKPEKSVKAVKSRTRRYSRYMNVQVIRGLKATNYRVKKGNATAK